MSLNMLKMTSQLCGTFGTHWNLEEEQSSLYRKDSDYTALWIACWATFVATIENNWWHSEKAPASASKKYSRLTAWVQRLGG